MDVFIVLEDEVVVEVWIMLVFSYPLMFESAMSLLNPFISSIEEFSVR